MIRKNLKILIITSAIILLPILAGIFLWNRLPDQLPIHWNTAGEIDGWSSKFVGVFGLSSIMLALQWLTVLLLAADPKRKNYSEKILQLVFWLIPVLCNVLSAVIYSTSLGKEIRMNVFAPLLIGLLSVVIGNYLPKCQQNYTVGIKIPWTLNSEENWNKTHRLAGWIWVFCGLVMMPAGFFNLFPVLIIAALIMVFVPLIYSYILYRRGI